MKILGHFEQNSLHFLQQQPVLLSDLGMVQSLIKFDFELLGLIEQKLELDVQMCKSNL